MRGTIRIGTSGWAYPRRRGVVYPRGLRQRDELRYLAERLDTIEINASFYALQRPERFAAWREQTPEGFVFAVKGSRFVTHLKRLADTGAPLANFFASGLLGLGPALGPLLWQVPATLRFDAPVLEAFLAALPRDERAAHELAVRHDERVAGRALLTAPGPLRIRHALEVRDASFAAPPALELLRRHAVALVVSDAAQRFPYLVEDTADFRYVRLHGHTELYASGYSERLLRQWARQVREWADAGQDVFVYFDNDARCRAPFDAIRLRELLAR